MTKTCCIFQTKSKWIKPKRRCPSSVCSHCSAPCYLARTACNLEILVKRFSSKLLSISLSMNYVHKSKSFFYQKDKFIGVYSLVCRSFWITQNNHVRIKKNTALSRYTWNWLHIASLLAIIGKPLPAPQGPFVGLWFKKWKEYLAVVSVNTRPRPDSAMFSWNKYSVLNSSFI